MEYSKEILAFKKDFEQKTGIKVPLLIEERTFFHWKRLVFVKMNCEEMAIVSKYIKDTFSTPGIFTHLCVSLGSYENRLSLTVDVKAIKEFILKV